MKQKIQGPLILATSLLLEKTLLLSEMFYSIQGESSFAGYPCLFFRLAGCNLRCSYCDAAYTYDEPGTKQTIGQLFNKSKQFNPALIEITGGEPLLQENIYPLINLLISSGRTVLLETNGSISLSQVPEQVIKIVDFKCPDSGMHLQMDFNNIKYINPNDEIKFVVSSKSDFNWVIETISQHDLLSKAKILVSPVVNKINPSELASLILKSKLHVRLQVQLHQMLWPDKDRGV